MKNVRILTYLGLIPFIFLSLLNLFNIGAEFNIEKILSLYAALILSFLGGIYFGFAVKLEKSTKYKKFHKNLLLISVIPQLYAWFVLMIFHDYNLIKISLIVGFLLLSLVETYYFDRFLDQEFLKMRCKVSMIAVIFLALSIDNSVYKCEASKSLLEKITIDSNG